MVGFVRVNNQNGQHGCSSPSAGSCSSSPSLTSIDRHAAVRKQMMLQRATSILPEQPASPCSSARTRAPTSLLADMAAPPPPPLHRSSTAGRRRQCAPLLTTALAPTLLPPSSSRRLLPLLSPTNKNNRQRADSVPTAARQGQKGLSMCQNIFNSCKMEKMNGIPAANCTRLRVAFLRSHIFRRWYNINFLVSTYHSCIPIYASNAHSPLHVLHCS